MFKIKIWCYYYHPTCDCWKKSYNKIQMIKQWRHISILHEASIWVFHKNIPKNKFLTFNIVARNKFYLKVEEYTQKLKRAVYSSFPRVSCSLQTISLTLSSTSLPSSSSIIREATETTTIGWTIALEKCFNFWHNAQLIELTYD